MSQYFSVKPSDGVKATSFAKNAKMYINPEKLLPLDRFLPKPAGAKRGAAFPKSPRGAPGGGFSRGGGRGGFAPRGGAGAWRDVAKPLC